MMRAPSFVGLKPASPQSVKSKQANRGIDTRAERQLRSAVWRLGLRFRKNVRKLPGKPDIVFVSARIVVFCDGDFWHGRDWHRLRRKLELGNNSSYWVAKIQSNIERDQRVSATLESDGWTVVRVWETDVLTCPTEAADMIQNLVETKLRAPAKAR